MSRSLEEGVTPGRCWFCGQHQGDLNSLAFPFWSNLDESVRVLIIPRCAHCFQRHEHDKFRSGMVVVGAGAGAMLLLKLLFATILPVSEGWQTAGMISALIMGLIAGIVFVSRRESRSAAAVGSRPSWAYREHPEYLALTQDSTSWRGTYSAATTGGAYRRETVSDRRLEFASGSRMANAAEALEQAVRASGIDAERSDEASR